MNNDRFDMYTELNSVPSGGYLRDQDEAGLVTFPRELLLRVQRVPAQPSDETAVCIARAGCPDQDGGCTSDPDALVRGKAPPGSQSQKVLP